MTKPNITATLRRTKPYQKYQDDRVYESPVNPDGEDGARYIENLLQHMGEITYLALNHIQDHDLRNEISRRAVAAFKGLP